MIMKKLLLFSAMLICGFTTAMAQKPASIHFDNVLHNFGALNHDSLQVVTCTFTFTNEGEEPLVINQAVASCGCTVPQYSKEPVLPGQKGEIKVKYDGRRNSMGHFRKTVTVRTNGVPEMTRLIIEGDVE